MVHRGPKTSSFHGESSNPQGHSSSNRNTGCANWDRSRGDTVDVTVTKKHLGFGWIWLMSNWCQWWFWVMFFGFGWLLDVSCLQHPEHHIEYRIRLGNRNRNWFEMENLKVLRCSRALQIPSEVCVCVRTLRTTQMGPVLEAAWSCIDCWFQPFDHSRQHGK